MNLLRIPSYNPFLFSSRIRRFYFAINQNGEILSSLEKSAKEYIPSITPPNSQLLRKAQSSKDIFKTSSSNGTSWQALKSTREFEAAPILTFRRTQSSDEIIKPVSDVVSLPTISSAQEPVAKFTRGRSNRGANLMPPQSSLAESKICYFSVSYIVYLIVQNFFF